MKVLKTTNQYGIEMLEISGGKYPIKLTLRKANAILEANKSEEAWIEVDKYNRKLRQISYTSGKTFLVGDGKIDAVLSNIEAIEALSTPSTPKKKAKAKTKRKAKAKVVKA